MRRMLSAVMLFVLAGTCRAEQFDYYLYPVLSKAVGTPGKELKELKEVSAAQLADFTSLLPDTSSAFLIVQSNDKRLCRMLVQPARQKLPGDKIVSLLLIDKFVTYRGTTERAIHASGQSVQLYPGLRFSVDLGQAVPESIGGDLQVIAGEKDPGAWTLKPLKDAKLFVVVEPIAGVVPKKAPKLVPGENFEPRFFAGRFKLHDDGRRSGELKLEVAENGEISGTFTSDRDGREYDVTGKVGNPKHAISFTIKLPATVQSFNGFMFTGNGKIIAGTTKLQEREAGFYAERIDD